ncbi:hypothetical protein NEMBOFW57_005950 [Staphylotrichum longicolle]|uniref:Uncharacterized protein n=1 Tax=Staphylotrichum longicolle TaxID=669026 RepID=A0AAD4HWF0_9PEZI|nr:hypothetical protein NEMBOFW57_005950 [Staphylotrichum longicolle]
MSVIGRRESMASTMEGALSVPPDRGTIIGRAVWKPMRPATSRDPPRAAPEGIFLSVYKSKQYPISSIADCQVQMLAHRKQGPVLPTLVINVLPDPLLDKARKRRSSRTAAFSAPKETGPTTLLFRPGDEQSNLQDWSRFVQQLIQPHIPDRAPLSPVTPASPTFINPFAPRSREPSDMQQRPESGSGGRPGFFLKNPSQTNSIRDRPVTFSADSPSLRSKRSDLSSQTSSMTQSHMAFQNYNPMVPADLPSPATTIGEYQGEFIEGWTSAQGRSSALSSPIRERESVSSQAQAPLAPIPDSETPTGPRETILDRAFQLRCIPGSEREVPGEEKLSSLARFEALMREVDEKRKQREAEEAKTRPQDAVPPAAEPKSAFDEDDTDSDDDSDKDSDDDSDEMAGEEDAEDQFPSSTTAQRALDFIAAPPTCVARLRGSIPAELQPRGIYGAIEQWVVPNAASDRLLQAPE